MRLRAPLLLLASMLLVLLIAACSGGDEDEPPQEQTNAPGVIPTATPYPANSAPTPIIVSGGSSGGEQRYTVESGDTLLAIANQFNTTVEAIMTRNNLASAAELRIGQELIIPTGGSTAAPAGGPATPPPSGTTVPGGGQTYTVASGDTASAIAARFGITIEALAAANNRSVGSLDALQLNETLVIPAP